MISIDLETRSELDIRDSHVGTHAYAQHESTRILLLCLQDTQTGESHTWDYFTPGSIGSERAKRMLEDAMRRGDLFSAYNAEFEIVVMKARLLADVWLHYRIEDYQWRDTALLSKAACLPNALGDVAKFLKVSQKDNSGTELIKVFSDIATPKHIVYPDGKKAIVKAISPQAHGAAKVKVGRSWVKANIRQAWANFRAYCRQDVRVEIEVAKRLRSFQTTVLQDGWVLNLQINDRGAPVNAQALQHANQLAAEYAEGLVASFEELTGGLRPSQGKKVKEWMQDHGYPHDNLQKGTLDEFDASTLSGKGPEAMEIFRLLSYAAVKKAATMARSLTEGSRLRSQFIFHGARTGRWTSQGVQLQNVKRPDGYDSATAYSDIKLGLDYDLMHILHGNIYEMLAATVRNFIEPKHGQILDIDYSNIEGRVAAWLAGQEDKLQLYRDGACLYTSIASKIFSMPVAEITKDSRERYVGKQADLSLQFSSGAKKFHETCLAGGIDLPKKEAQKTVDTYRSTYSHISGAWNAFNDAILAALKEPFKEFHPTEHVCIYYATDYPFKRLMVRLPSGRELCYPHPGAEWKSTRQENFLTGETYWIESYEITFHGHIKGKHWGRKKTYGADVFQSATQATAFDIMLHGCMQATEAGFDIFAVVHDQALAEEGDPELFHKTLTDHPHWLPADFPLEADGGLRPYYSK